MACRCAQTHHLIQHRVLHVRKGPFRMEMPSVSSSYALCKQIVLKWESRAQQTRNTHPSYQTQRLSHVFVCVYFQFSFQNTASTLDGECVRHKTTVSNISGGIMVHANCPNFHCRFQLVFDRCYMQTSDSFRTRSTKIERIDYIFRVNCCEFIIEIAELIRYKEYKRANTYHTVFHHCY